MYAVGTSVLYGRVGVCEIESICVPPFQKDNGNLYYKLRPVFTTSNELIYTPVSQNAPIRPLVNSGEALACLEQLSQLKPPVFRAKRMSDLSTHYHDLLTSCQLKDYLLLIKEIYCKQRELAAHNKKLGQLDCRYLKIAEKLVCEEFAAVLHTVPDLIRERLYAAMEQEETA